MATSAQRIRTLTEQALDEFESGQSLSALVRQAHRISVLRHDYAAQVWFEFQQREIGVTIRKDDDVLLGLKGKLVALLGEPAALDEYLGQYRRWESSRQMMDSKNIHPTSIDQLEVLLEQTQRGYDEIQLPPNLTPIDAALMARDQDNARAKLVPLLASLKNIMSRVRQSVHDYLVATEAELDAGRDESSFFDQVYAHINLLLNSYAPEAAKNFVAAQERMSGGGGEDISHALTSCRRMIKSLADRLYPPTNAEVEGLDGIPRKMTDDAYRNRLLQYVREQVGKHKNGAVLQAIIDDLGSRLNALDALASKGVHADTSIAEARTCVLQTYLLAGDLLSIAVGESILLSDDPDGANVSEATNAG